MRISELYGKSVVSEGGEQLGVVRDVRLRHAPGARGRRARFEVAGLVIAPPGLHSRAAHAWGYAAGRAKGPWLLRRALERGVRSSRFVPAQAVRDWRAPAIRVGGSGADLESLSERLSR
jgi:hypothetical protein